MAKKSKIPDHLTLVTPTNRKFCVVMGRTMLVKGTDGSIDKESWFIIRPRLKEHEGWFEWDDNKCRVTEGEDAQDYANGFNDVITTLIRDGRLYIDPAKKIITFKL